MYVDIDNLYDLPCHVYWKDLNGFYQESNDYPSLVLGINKSIQFTGNNDHDFLLQDAALIVQNNDRTVIERNSLLTLVEEANFLNQINERDYATLSYKQPFYIGRTKKLAGVFGISFILSSDNPVPSYLSKLNQSIQDVIGNTIQKHRNIRNIQQLTSRQIDCLYYLVLGKSAKETANRLGISNRTVEHHLVALKNKYQCMTKSELIIKALQEPAIKSKLSYL